MIIFYGVTESVEVSKVIAETKEEIMILSVYDKIVTIDRELITGVDICGKIMYY